MMFFYPELRRRKTIATMATATIHMVMALTAMASTFMSLCVRVGTSDSSPLTPVSRAPEEQTDHFIVSDAARMRAFVENTLF